MLQVGATGMKIDRQCWWLFPLEYRGRCVKLTTHLHLVPRLRIVELYFRSLLHLHKYVLN
jgi:hypothetical protein